MSHVAMIDTFTLLAGYRRAARFLVPYRWRMLLVLLTGVAATSFGLAQPYISKLLIDEALLKRDFHALVTVSLMMLAVTVASFALNIFSSYQYVRVSALTLFDMRVALYRHLQSLSPRFWARAKLGDVVSRINNDISEVQRIWADSLLSVLSNVVFLVGSSAIMISLNAKVFLLSMAVLPFSLWSLHYYQHRLAWRVKTVRERGADIGSFLLETLLGFRLMVTANAEKREVERAEETLAMFQRLAKEEPKGEFAKYRGVALEDYWREQRPFQPEALSYRKLPPLSKSTVPTWWTIAVKPLLDRRETLERIKGTQLYDELCKATDGKDYQIRDELKRRCRPRLASLAKPG